MSRWIRFITVILIGIAGGLLYGWWVSPVEYVDTSPTTLKSDYKADYVLMVAEAYSLEGDLSLAVRRLAVLGSQAPGETVRQAILSAEPYYADADLALMRALQDALEAFTPALETPGS